MNPIFKNSLCALLVTASTPATIGCASQPTVKNPSPATIGRWVHYGDPLAVVRKTGEEEKFTAWVITPTAVGSGFNTPIAYDDMREIRKLPIDREPIAPATLYRNDKAPGQAGLVLAYILLGLGRVALECAAHGCH